MLVTGTLERNGLREAAANLIGKVKGATPGKILGVYTLIRGFFGAFNVGIGGIAGFVRPVLMPMATASIENKGLVPDEKHIEDVKGMAAGVENIADRQLNSLSGGERQKALIAAALAQSTDMLFLDEPTSFLDYRHQVETLELIERIKIGRASCRERV